MGKAYYHQGDFQQAKITLEQALALQPSGKVALLLSKVCSALDAYEQAGTYYQEALERDADCEDGEYHHELAAKGVKVRARLRVVDIGRARGEDELLEQAASTLAT